eukprot:TRINITY_DN48998_c0_g1_i1.p1 TRINITY_DN48998_c0_g1~~TRINITY_DN48998_c0_g1_i1.p1  ORF type:complete len:387 (+),score=29.58 TRINITY_DN48998_c0_g1_i1:42-1202(+)
MISLEGWFAATCPSRLSTWPKMIYTLLSVNEASHRRQFFFWNVIFLVTGIIQVLMAYQFVVIGFAANGLNILNASGNPVGQMLVSAIQPELWRELKVSTHQGYTLYLIALSELGGGFFCQLAIAMIGSGLHSIIYSSIVVLNALVGIALFNKQLTRVKWIALMLISGSVALASLGQPFIQDDKAWWQACFGVACSMLATICFSFTYVLSNDLLSPSSNSGKGCTGRVSPMVVALKLGLIESGVLGLYFFNYVLPRWDELVAQPMDPMAPPAARCVLWYVVYLLVCALHQYGFYYCLSFSDLAAVTSGVNKSIQASVLFFASSALFCHVAPAQCISTYKVLGTIGVCAGVLIYASEDMTDAWRTDESRKQGDDFAASNELTSIVGKL